jgi:hypothetical protein
LLGQFHRMKDSYSDMNFTAGYHHRPNADRPRRPRRVLPCGYTGPNV